jgi:hypothetical protein
MALITESLIIAISEKIERAEKQLQIYLKEYEAASATQSHKIGEIKSRSEEHEAVLIKLHEDGNNLVKSYNELWREYFVLNSQRAEIINGIRFNNKEAWEAFLNDGMQQVLQPYDMNNESWEIWMQGWRDEHEPKYSAYREDHEIDYNAAAGEAMVKIDAKQVEIFTFFDAEGAKYEKALSDAEVTYNEASANFKEKEDKLNTIEANIVTTETTLTETTAKHAEALIKFDATPEGPSKDELAIDIAKMQDEIDTLTQQLVDLKDKRDNDALPNKVEAAKILADVEEVRLAAQIDSKNHNDAVSYIQNDMEWAKQEHIDLASANQAVMTSGGIYEITFKPINDYIEEGRNSNLVRKRAEEEEARKNIAEASIKDKRREKIILEFKADSEQEHKEFQDDTEIMKTLLKQELNISEENETKIREIIQGYEAEEGDFNAAKALELTRASLFDLNKSGVIDKIKAACSKGLTTVSFDTEEISGTEILGLIWKGYKITHNSKPLAGPNRQLTRISTKVIVEWGIENTI